MVPSGCSVLFEVHGPIWALICFSSYRYSCEFMMVCHYNTVGDPFRMFRSLGCQVQDGPYGPGSNVDPMAHLYKMFLFLQILLYSTVMMICHNNNLLVVPSGCSGVCSPWSNRGPMAHFMEVYIQNASVSIDTLIQ